MDISLFNRNLFLTREFEATKRLNFFQKELSLYLYLSVFDGSSHDKKVVSTFRPFLLAFQFIGTKFHSHTMKFCERHVGSFFFILKAY